MAEVAFHAALAANRSRLNARYAAAALTAPLDPGIALAQLDGMIGPIIDAIAASQPAAVDVVLDELFDLLLQLLADGIVGPDARRPVVADAWRALMPLLPGALAAAPRRVAASLTNALYNLAGVSGARPDAWLTTMRRAGPYCGDVEILLAAGQVAGWLAGLAQYRPDALELCRSLPPLLLESLFGLTGDRPPSAYAGILERLATDPWLTPRAAALSPVPRRLVLVRRAGAFRGFGGQFLAPPTVGWSDGHFYAQDGDNWWLLTADAFGATFHRAAAPAKLVRAAPGSPFSVGSRGEVQCGAERATFPEVAAMGSWAADATTLAVTTSLSHHVLLFALVGEAGRS